MPPIQIFSASPINAQAAINSEPNTAATSETRITAPAETTRAAPTATSGPPAQPGGLPMPTPTQTSIESAPMASGPQSAPAPTPGTQSSAGARYALPSATANAPPQFQPPQMQMQLPPHLNHGTSTTPYPNHSPSTTPYTQPSPYAQPGHGPSPSLYAHNPGYRAQPYNQPDDEGTGMWDQAKRWASAAGESLAAAESEVWKKLGTK